MIRSTVVSAPDPLDFLFSLERLGMKFGLESIAALCEALDHPERAFRSIVIAGTNGKGSVTVMVETALRAAGHRTARYTSPHLVRLEERFHLLGQDVSTSDLRDAVGRVQEAVELLLRTGAFRAPPTFFECATAAAFELFRRGGVDIAVLEVGLGGRLDATNVVMPIAAAITSIDFDHQAQLGDTLEAIAREKAGVIKPGIPVVCGPLPPEADRVVRDTCAERGARMVRAADVVRMTARGDGAIDVASGPRRLDGVTLALSGGHQQENAAVAVALLDELARSGIAVPDGAVRAGLSRAVWPARLERFQVDGDGHPAGCRAQPGRRAGPGRLPRRDRLDGRHAPVRRPPGQGRPPYARAARSPVRGHRLHDGAHAARLRGGGAGRHRHGGHGGAGPCRSGRRSGGRAGARTARQGAHRCGRFHLSDRSPA